MPLAEPARAKVNLTLEVLGRRKDGYHELRSLVVFADAGDELTLEPGPALVVETSGPHGQAIDGENLIERVGRSVLAAAPGSVTGHFRLTKNLPVASGIGGGSADAAAALRLLARANPPARSPRSGDGEGSPLPAMVDWWGIARQIGSDVPSCFLSRAVYMAGVGANLREVRQLPRLPAVLVNPGLKLATPDVFRALAARPVGSGDIRPATRRQARFASIEAVLDHARGSRNDLEAPAIALQPVIADVLVAIAGTPGCLLARMSGSGATCFGLYRDAAASEAAAARLAAVCKAWWIVATTLG
ncbi:MAG: 4-(cytidine 5'-diphospho)-2-C-methyl-D-erythritol kinase [Hyphomicrobiaceae bacterium]